VEVRVIVDQRIQRSEGNLRSVGDILLRYRTWDIANPRAAIVIVPGLGEHSGRYERTAADLASYGFACYAFDLRGHGGSEGRRGHVRSFDVYLQDLDRFRREVDGFLAPGLPRFLLGHSMGGLIALRYQQEYGGRFRGAVISSPWLATAMPIPRWQVTAAAALGRLAPALPMGNRIDAAALSHDREVVNAYRADPLVHDRITPRLFLEASRAMGLVLQRADRLRNPLLFLIAAADRVVDAQRSLQFARQLPTQLTTVKLYPGMYHEVLNEVDRQVALRDLRDWMAARIS
jgi:alpha-beta hydrolase superfamily lysophospholipase